MTQWFGLSLGSVAAAGLSVSAAEGCTAAKKNLLKAQGTGFLVCAAQNLQNAHDNTQVRGRLSGRTCLLSSRSLLQG